MSKSLTESAAEILNASIGKAPKDASDLSTQAQEVGGSTLTKPEGEDNPGAKAAAPVKVAAKPGTAGAGAEPMKKVAEEAEEEISEEEFDAYLESLSEEELEQFIAELDLSEEEVAEETEEVVSEEETVEVSEEEIAEARKAKMKAMVNKNMGSCSEDVDALFNGESLSEDFRTKATTIFEAAVRARVEAIAEQVIAEQEIEFENSIVEATNALTEQVDEYLNYVVEQWMEENKLAVETGLRAEIAEDFMAGLKNLFAEHYIDVPEEKADIVEEMAQAVVDAEAALEEALTVNANIAKALNEAKATEVLRKICEGLTEVQVQKIKALAEGVEFTTEGEYTEKLAVIRESYFPSKSVKAEAPVAIVETEETKETTTVMDYYVNAITKQLPK